MSRYENKRRLIEGHVHALYNLPQVSRESAAELNELRDKANRALASLKNLSRTTEEILNDMFVYRISQKLDNASRKAWKLKNSDDSTIKTFADLEKFIANRARVLEELYLTQPSLLDLKRSHWLPLPRQQRYHVRCVKPRILLINVLNFSRKVQVSA